MLQQQLIALALFVLVLAALNACWIAYVGLRQLWYILVTFPRRYVLYGTRFLPELHRPVSSMLLQRLLVYVSLVVTYPLVLWHCARSRRDPASTQTNKLLLLALTGILLLLQIITRLNWSRIYAISMPAFILLAWLISDRVKPSRYTIAAVWLIVTGLAAKQVRSRHLDQPWLADVPAGRILVSQQNYEKFTWLTHHTQPGDSFLQAQLLNTYLPLNLRNPIFIDGLWATEPTRPEFVQLAIHQVEQRRVEYIFWSPRLAFPENNLKAQDHLEPFRLYLTEHYIRTYSFSDGDEVWERR